MGEMAREKYASDAEHKAKCQERGKRRIEKERSKRLSEIAADAAKVSFRKLVRNGLVSKEERSKRKKELKAAWKKNNERLPIFYDGGYHSIRGVRDELRIMRNKINKLDKYLDSFQKTHGKPWHLDGYPNLQTAYNAGHHAAVEEMKAKWKNSRHARRAKEKLSGGHISNAEWRECMKTWGYKCAYCGAHRSAVRDPSRRMDLEMDHVVPLGPGLHIISNVVPACKTCNTSKSDQDVIEWAIKKGMTLSHEVLTVYRENAGPL
jgi:5-methylcytosine-specific restriction endonuclease McrA